MYNDSSNIQLELKFHKFVDSNTHSSDCDETKGGNVVACDCLSVYLENIATFFPSNIRKGHVISFHGKNSLLSLAMIKSSIYSMYDGIEVWPGKENKSPLSCLTF